ncbi:MAG: zinc ribbon domain-containing protein [Bacillota bacterium]
MKCNKCGHLLPDDSEFCQYCGARLNSGNSSTIMNAAAEKNETKCYKCGHLLPDDSEFCQYCGAGLNSDNAIKNAGIPIEEDGDTDPPPVQDPSSQDLSWQDLSSQDPSAQNASAQKPSVQDPSTQGFSLKEPPPQEPSVVFSAKRPNVPFPQQDSNHGGKGNKTDRIITIAVCALLCVATGYFNISFLLVLLVTGGILYLIMHKGLKIKERVFAISFLAILHSIGLFVGVWIVWIQNDFNMADLTMLANFLDLVLCAALFVLGCCFYVKKSRGCLKALLILESLYIGINAYMLVAIANTANDVGMVNCHIVWRALIVFLIIRYLSDTKSAITKTTGFGRRNEGESRRPSSANGTSAEEQIRDRIANSQYYFDSDFGYSPENPVCTASVADVGCYLAALRTQDGRAFTWVRKASNIPCAYGELDEYLLLLNGEEYKTVFINHCGRNNRRPPAGLVLDPNAFAR